MTTTKAVTAQPPTQKEINNREEQKKTSMRQEQNKAEAHKSVQNPRKAPIEDLESQRRRKSEPRKENLLGFERERASTRRTALYYREDRKSVV